MHQEGYCSIFRISLSHFAAVETEFRLFLALSVDDLEQRFAVKAISVLDLFLNCLLSVWVSRKWKKTKKEKRE